ncbi:MAG: hypothetical protein DMD35_05345 [Gemmatimonadetes bacterium]|nr:MAG: hypothetical protein DMD35_05345 [Gemmatimonadota bacterium]
MTKRRVVIGTLVAAALVLSLGRWASEQYTDSLWYAALGASDVWRARFVNGMALRTVSFLVASAFAFVNLYAVRQSVVSLVLPRRIANIEIGEEVPGRYLLLVTAALAVALGVALALPGDLWSVALLARIGRPFQETEPYFGADLGFFVYWLPFETALYYWAMILLLVVIGVVILLYALTPSLRWTRGALYVSAYVRRHFTMLGGMLLLGLAWSYRLGMYRLLVEGSGVGGTFTSVDQRVTVPATLVLALVTLCAAVIVLWAGWNGQMRLAFFSVSAVLLLSLVARTVAPLVARRSVDPDPDATAKQERPYQATRLSYTRRGYGVVERMRAESLGVGFRTMTDVNGRVTVWDASTLRRFAERERHVSVVGTGAGWAPAPSGLSALLVERGEDAVSDGREFWNLGRFDASAADERGQPVRTPPSGRFGDETVIPEPAVFDSAPAYSLRSDSLQQLAGVEMVSTRSRLAHAWSLQNFRLLFGDLPLDRPTILEHRDVRERVDALAPFFVQGTEILPVVADDSLYWALELYVASDDYPLAQRFHFLGAQRGYFQHAATALLHATSGRVRLVLASAPEPITATWAARFPALFVPSTVPRRRPSPSPRPAFGATASSYATSRRSTPRTRRSSVSRCARSFRESGSLLCGRCSINRIACAVSSPPSAARRARPYGFPSRGTVCAGTARWSASASPTRRRLMLLSCAPPFACCRSREDRRTCRPPSAGGPARRRRSRVSSRSSETACAPDPRSPPRWVSPRPFRAPAARRPPTRTRARRRCTPRCATHCDVEIGLHSDARSKPSALRSARRRRELASLTSPV